MELATTYAEYYGGSSEELPKGRSICLESSAGGPAVGVLAYLTADETKSELSDAIAIEVTDAEGRATFRVPSGSYSLWLDEKILDFPSPIEFNVL